MEFRLPQWEPLFVGDQAHVYRRTANDIADVLNATTPDPMDWSQPLLHAYRAAALGSVADAHRFSQLVDACVEKCSLQLSPPSLYAGVAGIGWLIAHTNALLNQNPDGDAAGLEALDRALTTVCNSSYDSIGFDLISGIIGIGLYFVERLPAVSAEKGLRAILDELERRSEGDGVNAKWRTPASRLRGAARWDHVPRYDLGMAHGNPGVIGFLAALLRRGKMIQSTDFKARAARLLRRAARWLIQRHLPDGRFPSHVVYEQPTGHLRLAWCYGDLGVATAILAAAYALSDITLEQQAIDIGLACAERRIDTGVVDSGICHGAAGNGHLFNRFFVATGHPAFRGAARHWFGHALASRGRVGLAGFRSWDRGQWRDDPGFLTGVSGIALTFLAATTSLEPSWDRVLLAAL